MAAPQVASAGIGLSTGTVILIVGVAVVGTVIYLNSKNKKNKIVDINNLSSDDEKYENHKWIVKNAIKQNDKEKLERLSQNKNIMKYDDLAKLIKDNLTKSED